MRSLVRAIVATRAKTLKSGEVPMMFGVRAVYVRVDKTGGTILVKNGNGDEGRLLLTPEELSQAIGVTFDAAELDKIKFPDLDVITSPSASSAVLMPQITVDTVLFGVQSIAPRDIARLNDEALRAAKAAGTQNVLVPIDLDILFTNMDETAKAEYAGVLKGVVAMIRENDSHIFFRFDSLSDRKSTRLNSSH